LPFALLATYPDQFSLAACWTSLAAAADAGRAPKAHAAATVTTRGVNALKFIPVTVEPGSKSG
jgi:hypothetical protein